jgi:DNA-binding PadR family transcriptional regulator
MKHTILALLANAPAHGYELKQVFDELFGAVYPPLNVGQVYTTLSRLERDGLVQDRVIEQESRPDKRIYKLTDAGRKALQAWLSAEVSATRLKDEFYLKLILVQETGIADPLELIDRQRREYMQMLRDLNDLAMQPEIKQHPASLLLVKGAVLHLKADLEWLDLCEQQLG